MVFLLTASKTRVSATYQTLGEGHIRTICNASYTEDQTYGRRFFCVLLGLVFLNSIAYAQVSTNESGVPAAVQYFRDPATIVEAAPASAASLSTGDSVFRSRFAEFNTPAKLTSKQFEAIDRPTDKERDEKTRIGSHETFHWRSALEQSFAFLGIQHGFRFTQKKTTQDLGGNFFRDWGHSVRNLRGWVDGDSFVVNYIGHSMQGSATGRIYVNNSDNARKQEFGFTKEYWKSRGKALAWSAAWSTQFELGPISEASIGNVGLHDDHGPSRMGWCDLVVTPVVGTGFLVGEDAIDKYILKNWLEKKSQYRVSATIKFLRSVLTPTTSFANLLRGKMPWKRDNRN